MKKSELQNLSSEELINLSETNTSDFRWNRSDIYKIALKKYKKNGEKEKSENMRKEIIILDLSTKNSPKKRFDYMMSGTTDKGEEWEYPDLEKDFPIESIEYYKNRAIITNNPILKARYSDVIWEINKDVKYSSIAIEAYLDCCPIYFKNEWDPELSDSLERAMVLASIINNQGLIEECLKKDYEFIKQLVEKGRFRYLIEIIESTLKQKKIEDQIDYEYLISSIEDAIVYYAENVPDSFHLQQSFMELLVKIWQIRKNKDECQKIKARIAESFIEEAEWKKVNYPSGNMVAAIFYEKAMQEYIELGTFPEKVNELKNKIKEANEASLKTEYKGISAKVEIPKKKMNQYLETYKGKKILYIFEIMSIDKNLFPSYERSKKEAIEQAKKFVIQHIFPVRIMKGKICVKQISEGDDKLEYNSIKNFQLSYKITGILLNKIFDLLGKEHPEYIKSLIKYLSSTGIIDKERIKIIKHGIQAFEDKKYVASIHILIFQIEGILRDLLEKLGLPTFSYRSNEMREKMFSKILETLYQIEGVDKDFLKFIEIYLCDIRGDNYRNDIAHGLVPLELFTKENTQLLLLILIKLASYSIVKKDKTKNIKSTADKK